MIHCITKYHVSVIVSHRRDLTLTVIGTNNYQTISYYRTGGRSGGGCAIIYTDTRFIVEKLDVDTGEGVGAVWALFTPRGVTSNSRVRRIAVGSFYVSPNSVYKTRLYMC